MSDIKSLIDAIMTQYNYGKLHVITNATKYPFFTKPTLWDPAKFNATECQIILLDVDVDKLITDDLFKRISVGCLNGAHVVVNHLNTISALKEMVTPNLELHPIVVNAADGICVYRLYDIGVRTLKLEKYAGTYTILPISLEEFKNHITTEVFKYVIGGTAAKLHDVTYTEEKSIDVIICGCGRPEIFERTVQQLKKYLVFDGTLNYCYEDGLFQTKTSKTCLDIAKKYGFKYYHAEFINSYGHAITNVLNNASRSKYILFVEDDMECIYPVDLNCLWDCLEQNSWINQIRLLRDGRPIYDKFTVKVNDSTQSLSGAVHWYFNPGLWRMSYVRKHWPGSYRNIHHKFTEALLREYFNELDLCEECTHPCNLCIKCREKNITHKLGCTTLTGPNGESFFKHCCIGSVHVAKGSV